MKRAFDERNPPLAYLLTFRTYGSWLHGDQRGSVDRRLYNVYGTPKMPESENLQKAEREQQSNRAFILDKNMPSVVDEAIRNVCSYRNYELRALNVRSNHAHAVASFLGPPEKMVEGFKSWATRELRRIGLVDNTVRVWSRHCSTRYLWNEVQVDEAIRYVLYFQDGDFPSFDEVLE